MKREAARNAEIIRRRQDRQTFREIADATGLTIAAVRSTCMRNNVLKPPKPVERIIVPKPAPLSDIEIAAIRYRRARGETLESLRECFEVGKLTLRRVLEGLDA